MPQIATYSDGLAFVYFYTFYFMWILDKLTPHNFLIRISRVTLLAKLKPLYSPQTIPVSLLADKASMNGLHRAVVKLTLCSCSQEIQLSQFLNGTHELQRVTTAVLLYQHFVENIWCYKSNQIFVNLTTAWCSSFMLALSVNKHLASVKVFNILFMS
jgi:hypothetical protein